MASDQTRQPPDVNSWESAVQRADRETLIGVLRREQEIAQWYEVQAAHYRRRADVVIAALDDMEDQPND